MRRIVFGLLLISAVPVLASTVLWEVDGVPVYRAETSEATYQLSQDQYVLFFPKWGRNIQIFLRADSIKPGNLNCPGSHVLSLTTYDNGHAGLTKLPLKWKGLSFGGCGKQSFSDDIVTRKTLTIGSLAPDRVTGDYEMIIEGAGPRLGSILRISGNFDVAPTPR